MKTALITGASKGIGAEYAKILSKDYNLVLVARDKDGLKNIKSLCDNKNKMLLVNLDLTSKDAIPKLFHIIKKRNIVIDVLINNAGFGDYSKFDESDLNKQSNMIELNINSLTKITHYFLNQRNKKSKSYLLNMGSVAGFFPGPYMSVYFATKAYVMSFTEALIKEYKSDKNLSITLVCPGQTKTNFAKEANAKFSKNSDSPEDVARIALKGLFSEKEIVIPKIKNKVVRLLPRFMLKAFASSQIKNMK